MKRQRIRLTKEQIWAHPSTERILLGFNSARSEGEPPYTLERNWTNIREHIERAERDQRRMMAMVARI